MRLIDADYMKEHIEGNDGKIINKIMEWIDNQPTIDPQRWISCSETVDIPEHSVLACDKYGEYIIGFLCYEDDQWLCESEHEYMYDAVAWMPLPEPYEPQESEVKK